MKYGVHTEEYRGFTIDIVVDDATPNPWEDWDGEPPLAVYLDTDVLEYADDYGHINECPSLNRDQIKANLPAILEMLDVSSIFALRDSAYYADIVSIINDRLSEFVNDQRGSDRLGVLRDLWEMAGCVAVMGSPNGSGQGDYAEVLCVLTPKFLEDTGAPNTVECAKNAIQLFEDWAFGNVYGFEIEDAEGNFIDSCFGFFGDYDAEYGALSEAKRTVDGHIRYLQREHFKTLKTQIRNRVPLCYRTAMI